MKRICMMLGLGLLLSVGTGPAWSMMQELILEVPAEVNVPGPKICMADLGRVEGADRREANLLRQLDLGKAPAPGQIRVFTRSYLQFLLKQQTGLRTPRLKMGAQVTVRVVAIGVGKEEILAALNRLLPKRPEGVTKQWVEVSGIADTVWLGRGTYRVEAMAVGELPRLGPALFKVKLVGETDTKTLSLSGVIRKTAIAYRVKQLVKPLTTLEAGVFEPVEIELKSGREYTGAFPVNYRNTRLLRPGQLLEREVLQPVPWVARDQKVQVLLRGGGIEIKLTGIAKKDAWDGEQVTVLNPDSKQTFGGRVVGTNRVEVTFE